MLSGDNFKQGFRLNIDKEQLLESFKRSGEEVPDEKFIDEFLKEAEEKYSM